MSKAINEVRRQFEQRLAEAASTSFYGTIVNVDRSQRTCSVQVGNITYNGVLLYAIENASLKGMVAIPKEGSGVLLSRIGGSNRLFVEMVSEIDAVLFTFGEETEGVLDAGGLDMKAGDKVFKATTDGFTISGATYGLKQALTELIEQINLITVPTGTGPSGFPSNAAVFEQIKTKIETFMED